MFARIKAQERCHLSYAETRGIDNNSNATKANSTRVKLSKTFLNCISFLFEFSL